jgi:hypothetical protein
MGYFCRSSIGDVVLFTLAPRNFAGFPIPMAKRHSIDHLSVDCRILRADGAMDFFSRGQKIDVRRPSRDLIAQTKLFLLLSIDTSGNQLTVDFVYEYGI